MGFAIDATVFGRLIPHPVIYEVLRNALVELGRELQPLPSAAEPVNLLEVVSGEWVTEKGDNAFHGLKIEPSGKFQCSTGRVQDGQIRIISPVERKLSLKRKKKDTSDFIFEVEET